MGHELRRADGRRYRMDCGSAWTFDWGFAYVSSLVYLSVFGSIVAFVAYFKLIKHVGANRESFTAVAIPVVAMALSTVFEGYRWTSKLPSGPPSHSLEII